MSMYFRLPGTTPEPSIATHYGNETQTHEPCPACKGPSTWTYTRQEGDLRVAPLVIDCDACDPAQQIA